MKERKEREPNKPASKSPLPGIHAIATVNKGCTENNKERRNEILSLTPNFLRRKKRTITVKI